MSYDVVIKSVGMGVCEETLAKNLMMGFIHTLAGKENLPEHIILYGEGVKLTTTGSECVDDLEILEEKGVKILSCGICLDFYNLKEELQVGGITTMGEVVDIVSKSNFVFEP